jgi:toxin ParE1/3/4
MRRRVVYTPEAEQQLDHLDDWISAKASSEAARTFIRAIMDHCEGILVFPLAGRDRGDVRPGMRTTTFKKRTLIAYAVDESVDEVVVSVLGVFSGGQDWEPELRV